MPQLGGYRISNVEVAHPGTGCSPRPTVVAGGCQNVGAEMIRAGHAVQY